MNNSAIRDNHKNGSVGDFLIEHIKSNSSASIVSAYFTIVKPSVIYCLRQKGDTEGTEEVNPLKPYFLVYVRDDGTVRYNYTNANSAKPDKTLYAGIIYAGSVYNSATESKQIQEADSFELVTWLVIK
jgi:hypothetical protein